MVAGTRSHGGLRWSRGTPAAGSTPDRRRRRWRGLASVRRPNATDTGSGPTLRSDPGPACPGGDPAETAAVGALEETAAGPGAAAAPSVTHWMSSAVPHAASAAAIT